MRATYRLQLHAGCTFDDAAALVPYLARLGISHLYCSPILQAVPGSAHGYDVDDPTRLSDDLGGPTAFGRLARALEEHDLGLLVDIVPNHMALAPRANAWWWDLLEDGPASRWAEHFDLDWTPPPGSTRPSILVPVLGDHYGRVVEAGELALARRGGAFVVTYGDHELPLSLPSLAPLLADVAARDGSGALGALASALAEGAAERDPVARYEQREARRAELRSLLVDDPALAAAVDRALAAIERDPDALDDLLSRQHHRLAHWRITGEAIDHRRFFDVTDLVGVRVERPQTFTDTHALLLELVTAGTVTGLRIDHIDGLRDPAGYLLRLRDAAPATTLLVEKILERDEALPSDWPVEGTTGYEHLHRTDDLFVDPGGLRRLEADHAAHVDPAGFEEVARRSRRRIVEIELAAEVERLVDLLAEVCRARRRHRDHTRADLRAALQAVLVGFPVYRTYAVPGEEPSAEDRATVHAAITDAREQGPELDGELLDLFGRVLLQEEAGDLVEEMALRFQQLSGPVMAKGLEDTAFYRHVALLSRNEVGGDPGPLGDAVRAFHDLNVRTVQRWPHTLRTLSTHDTKRSADVRARLHVLSELAEPWLAQVDAWRDAHHRHWDGHAPDRRAELVLYQSALGAWPIGADRLLPVLEKSMREAKLETSWRDPDPRHEEVVLRFAERVLDDPAFRRSLEVFLADHEVVAHGRTTSLAATTLLLTAPGVPDLYQGTEAWDLSLVDPDNRRPVDHQRLAALLEEVAGLEWDGVRARADEGAPKLWLVQRMLQHRRDRPDRYAGGYRPLVATGERADHVVAFALDQLVVVVPRLVAGLTGGWGGTALPLPSGVWRDILSGRDGCSGAVRLSELLGFVPVAVLEPGGAP